MDFMTLNTGKKKSCLKCKHSRQPPLLIAYSYSECRTNQPLQQQQNTRMIARMMIQVQLSSKMWHKQLLFIMFPPFYSSGHPVFERFSTAQYYSIPKEYFCYTIYRS